VPLDAQGNFSMAFFTNFSVRGTVGLLDWYTLSTAIFATVLLAAHGATYLELKTDGPVHDRSALYARYLWAAMVLLFPVITVESWVVRPDLFERAMNNPFCWVGLFILIVSIIALVSGLVDRRETLAFAGSNGCIIGLMFSGAAALFPVVLYSTLAPENSLTAYAVASNANALLFASIWWPAGFLLAAAYFIFISRRYAGKVSVRRDNQGYY
jgi:cytochrome bd ubiquinol oxidase subunit II